MEAFYSDREFHFYLTKEEIDKINLYVLESDLKEKNTNEDLEAKVTLEVGGGHCGTQVILRPGTIPLERNKRIGFRFCGCAYSLLLEEVNLGGVYEGDHFEIVGEGYSGQIKK